MCCHLTSTTFDSSKLLLSQIFKLPQSLKKEEYVIMGTGDGSIILSHSVNESMEGNLNGKLQEEAYQLERMVISSSTIHQFGVNANSKIVADGLFRQQFEAFKYPISEGLEIMDYDRFQQLLSQLGKAPWFVKYPQKIANHKFLRSLRLQAGLILANDLLALTSTYSHPTFLKKIILKRWTFQLENSNDGYVEMSRSNKKTGRRVRVDGKTPQRGNFDGKNEMRFSLSHQGSVEKQEKNQMGCDTWMIGLSIGRENTEVEETKSMHLMAISSSNDEEEMEPLSVFKCVKRRNSIGKPSYCGIYKDHMMFNGCPTSFKGPNPEISVSDESTSEHSSCQSMTVKECVLLISLSTLLKLNLKV
ncbi:hypothetical protein Tco_0299170 [Tanacetum coccineum]